MPDKPKKEYCKFGGCNYREVLVRDLCRRHYKKLNALVFKKRYTWEELELTKE